MNVSIIVPVYNKEYAIEETIKSILSQTFDDFELLLVDDGSTDSSLRICDEYAKKDKRIRVIHKENGGVSSARNCGISNAKGEYIVFCDADDKLPENGIESLVQGMNEADMVIGGVKYVRINKNTNRLTSSADFIRTNILIDMKSNKKDFGIIWSNNNFISACCKIYKKSIITNNKIMFNTELVVLEDFCFVLDYMQCANKILSIENVVYEAVKVINIDNSDNFYRSREDYADDIVCAYNNMQRFIEYCGITDDSKFWKDFSVNLEIAYESLWKVKYTNLSERIEKYKRIHRVLKYDVFQRWIRANRKTYSFPRYIAMLRGDILGIIICRKAGL